MRNVIKYIVLLLLMVLIAGIGYFAYYAFFSKDLILDGPDMVYDWKTNELYGNWTGVDGSTMVINADEIILTTADATYSIPYDVDESADIKIKLKVNNPYEFFIFTNNDGILVLSGFAQDENENYVILNEFVSDEDSIDLNGFVSSYREKYEKSVFSAQVFTVDNVLDCVSYLGKTKDELNIENKYVDSSVGFYSVHLSGNLFGIPVSGSLYSQVDSDVEVDSLVFDEIVIYTNMSYNEVYNQFSSLYTLIDEGVEPYALESGGDVMWSNFGNDSYTVQLTHNSEASYVMVQIKQK